MPDDQIILNEVLNDKNWANLVTSYFKSPLTVSFLSTKHLLLITQNNPQWSFSATIKLQRFPKYFLHSDFFGFY